MSLYIDVTRKYFLVKNPEGIWSPGGPPLPVLFRTIWHKIPQLVAVHLHPNGLLIRDSAMPASGCCTRAATGHRLRWHDEGSSRRRFDFRSIEAINTPKDFNAE
jgi:hypothetical protein